MPEKSFRVWAAIVCSALLLCSLPVGSASAVGGTAGVTLVPFKDNTLIEREDGSQSDGAGPAIRAGLTNDEAGRLRRALVDFDVAGELPNSAVILTANLVLVLPCVKPGSYPTDDEVELLTLHRALRDWGEGTSVADGGQGVPATDDDATWLYTFYDSVTPGDSPAWVTPGGDYAPAGVPISMWDEALLSFTWAGIDLVTDLQYWVDNPGMDFGWVLLGNESAINSAVKFGSREASESCVPQLHITYHAPEPGARLLAAAVVLTLAALRRGARRP
jgi:hypothetical protein